MNKDFLYPLRVIHGRFHEWKINVLPIYKEKIKKPGAVFLVMTPEHGNLGDHAIAVSEKKLLKQLNIKYIEVTDSQIMNLKINHRLSLMNSTPILIHGGGNLGTLWPGVDGLMQDIVSSNPRSDILFFPNTVYYDGIKDINHIQKSISIFNGHKKLKIYARENSSFKFMKENYKNVGLAPDMVFMMNECDSDIKRNGCILCLRNDKEKTITEKEHDYLELQVKNIFNDDYKFLDMVVTHNISISERSAELEKQFQQFKNAELVITDRLHGMIFSAITGTPCIVIGSKSPKVKGCYEWIRDLPYIIYCEDISKISEYYAAVKGDHWIYDNKHLVQKYKELTDDLKSIRSRRIWH